MTTLSYRKRQREMAEYYNRAAYWLVAIGCVVVTLAWARLIIKVLL